MSDSSGIISYEQFEKLVIEALDEWVDAVNSRSFNAQRPFKQAAEDLIAGWKAAYPRQSKKISGFVQSYTAQRFNR